MRWGDEPFVDGEEEEERWRGEEEGESWISRTCREKCDLMKKKSRVGFRKINFVIPDSSACPGYPLQTPSDTAPNAQESPVLGFAVKNPYLGDKYSVLE